MERSLNHDQPASNALCAGRTYSSWVVTTTFLEVGVELEFIPEEFARDVDVLAADYNDMLTIEDLFGDGRGETAYTN